jgi:anti-sigma-K factor RskA
VNVQEYISSGIVESYVLGLASDEERREFEQVCTQYPEVLKARTNFELTLEKQAMQNAIAPPAGLRNKILGQLDSPGKVVSMQAAPAKSSWLKYAVAACMILLAGSLYYNISLYNKNKSLQSNYNNAIVKLNDMENDMHVITDTGNSSIKMAAMKGQPVSPASYATVYWDTTSKDAYLLINNLPMPPSHMQYQLWALLDGKPVDLGMIDSEFFVKQNRLLLKAKNVQNAQAFAISLEKKDRSNTTAPDGEIYVAGGL